MLQELLQKTEEPQQDVIAINFKYCFTQKCKQIIHSRTLHAKKRIWFPGNAVFGVAKPTMSVLFWCRLRPNRLCKQAGWDWVSVWQNVFSHSGLFQWLLLKLDPWLTRVRHFKYFKWVWCGAITSLLDKHQFIHQAGDGLTAARLYILPPHCKILKINIVTMQVMTKQYLQYYSQTSTSQMYLPWCGQGYETLKSVISTYTVVTLYSCPHKWKQGAKGLYDRITWILKATTYMTNAKYLPHNHSFRLLLHHCEPTWTSNRAEHIRCCACGWTCINYECEQINLVWPPAPLREAVNQAYILGSSHVIHLPIKEI